MSSSWNLSHPSKCRWIKIQKSYYMTKTSCNWGKMNLITSISWMRPSKAYFHDFHLRNFCWWLFVTWKRSSRTWLSHPSSPHLWLRWKFFEKIGNMFLHHLVALSSCNTRFEGEKWKLSQLKYSGEMQLFQKDFDKEKTSVDRQGSISQTAESTPAESLNATLDGPCSQMRNPSETWISKTSHRQKCH